MSAYLVLINDTLFIFSYIEKEKASWALNALFTFPNESENQSKASTLSMDVINNNYSTSVNDSAPHINDVILSLLGHGDNTDNSSHSTSAKSAPAISPPQLHWLKRVESMNFFAAVKTLIVESLYMALLNESSPENIVSYLEFILKFEESEKRRGKFCLCRLFCISFCCCCCCCCCCCFCCCCFKFHYFSQPVFDKLSLVISHFVSMRLLVFKSLLRNELFFYHVCNILSLMTTHETVLASAQVAYLLLLVIIIISIMIHLLSFIIFMFICINFGLIWIIYISILYLFFDSMSILGIANYPMESISTSRFHI
jgi:hypothetical protein